MALLKLAACFIGGLILTSLAYCFLVVPFHMWAAKKMGVGYDPKTNRYFDLEEK